MPPSRRQLLRSSALSLSMLSGCAMTDGLNSAKLSETTQSLNTSETDEAIATTENPPSLSCGPGPLPESGWPLPDRSPGRTNYAPDASGPTTKPSVEWSAQTTSSNHHPPPQFTRPIVADGRVYVGRSLSVGAESEPPDEQYVYAYDAETGEQVWRGATYDGGRAPGAPLVVGDIVLVPQGAGLGSRTLYAFDAVSGEQQWANSVNFYHVLPTPNGVFVAKDNEIRSLDSEGHLDEYVKIPGKNKVVGRLVWASNTLYTIVQETHNYTQSYTLKAIDTVEKTISWSKPAVSEVHSYTEVVATSCGVFVAADTALQAMKRDGTQAWSVDATIRRMATDSERVIAVDEVGRLRCLKVTDGKQLWQRIPDGGTDKWRGFNGAPVIAGETVYVSTADGVFVALSADDGSERWRLETDWSRTDKLSIVDDTLYAVGKKDHEYHLIAFR